MQVSAGRGGAVFDEDPKRWRLIAEFFTTTGRALEIATAVFPQNFVLLAGKHFHACITSVAQLIVMAGTALSFHRILPCWQVSAFMHA